jgi:hypothetical protein
MVAKMSDKYSTIYIALLIAAALILPALVEAYL